MTGDPHDLARFVAAQENVFAHALAELTAGRKQGHWMWFVFPQVAGLGHSAMARHFGIRSADEARAYLAHPLLGDRLRQAASAVLAHRGVAAGDIMGALDAAKLHSSMTLFEAVADDPAPFRAVLDGFYGGDRDEATLARLDA